MIRAMDGKSKSDSVSDLMRRETFSSATGLMIKQISECESN